MLRITSGKIDCLTLPLIPEPEPEPETTLVFLAKIKFTHKISRYIHCVEKCNGYAKKVSYFGNYRQYLRRFDENLP